MVFNKYFGALLKIVCKIATTFPNRSSLTILIYHSVFYETDPFRKGDVDIKTFEWQVQLLKQIYNVIPLSEAINLLKNNKLPPRSACITFDDGYADNAEIALPILKKYSVPATFFIATKYLDGGGNMWNDKIIEAVKNTSLSSIDLGSIGLANFDFGNLELKVQSAISLVKALKYKSNEDRENLAIKIEKLLGANISKELMMTSEQVIMLKNSGMEIGGHTWSHPILKKLSLNDARIEIEKGKHKLEELLGEPITLFAYPNGVPEQDYTLAHTEILSKLGFAAAVSTSWGTAADSKNIYQLPRFTPWDTSPMKFLLRLWANCLFSKTKFSKI